jgi:hypothetical protein
MRSRRTLAVIVCCLFFSATSCGGHAKKVSVTSKKPTKAPAHSTTAPVSPPGVPRVILQSGTEYQNGALVQFCLGSSCRQGPAKQSRALATPDPLLFLIDQVPASARVQLTRAGAPAPADTRALHVGTMMLYAPTVKAGTYLVRLDATWKGSTGSWVFSITIPKS